MADFDLDFEAAPDSIIMTVKVCGSLTDVEKEIKIDARTVGQLKDEFLEDEDFFASRDNPDSGQYRLRFFLSDGRIVTPEEQEALVEQFFPSNEFEVNSIEIHRMG